MAKKLMNLLLIWLHLLKNLQIKTMSSSLVTTAGIVVIIFDTRLKHISKVCLVDKKKAMTFETGPQNIKHV